MFAINTWLINHNGKSDSAVKKITSTVSFRTWLNMFLAPINTGIVKKNVTCSETKINHSEKHQPAQKLTSGKFSTAHISPEKETSPPGQELEPENDSKGVLRNHHPEMTLLF